MLRKIREESLQVKCVSSPDVVSNGGGANIFGGCCLPLFVLWRSIVRRFRQATQKGILNSYPPQGQSPRQISVSLHRHRITDLQSY